MNEYEHLFMQDCREKKRTASGARHRATRGKRSFTVHNPSDYLTKKTKRGAEFTRDLIHRKTRNLRRVQSHGQ